MADEGEVRRQVRSIVDGVIFDSMTFGMAHLDSMTFGMAHRMAHQLTA